MFSCTGLPISCSNSARSRSASAPPWPGTTPRPVSLDSNLDVVQVPADGYRGHPGRPSYPPVNRVSDRVDKEYADRFVGLTGPSCPNYAAGQGHVKGMSLRVFGSRAERLGRIRIN